MIIDTLADGSDRGVSPSSNKPRSNDVGEQSNRKDANVAPPNGMARCSGVRSTTRRAVEEEKDSIEYCSRFQVGGASRREVLQKEMRCVGNEREVGWTPST